MSKNVGNVLITKCVVDGNCDDFVKDTSEINDTPFESVFSKDSDKIQVIIWIKVEQLIIDYGTTQCLGSVEEFIKGNPVNIRILLISLDGSQSLFVSKILFGMYHDGFHGFSTFKGLINQMMLEFGESVDGCLALWFLGNWLGIEDWLRIATHLWEKQFWNYMYFWC